MAGGCGRSRPSAKGRPSISRCKAIQEVIVSDEEVEILLVEDNPTDLELTLRALRKANLANKLLALSDGAQALDYLFAEGEFVGRHGSANPRVVLLDLKLPKVDGIEVLRRIKSDPRTATVPVAVLTTSAEERDRLARANDR